MEARTPPIYHLPQDTLHQIFSYLPLRQITICKSVSKFFNQTLTSQSFTELVSTTTKTSLNLLAVRTPHHHTSRYVHPHDRYLHAFDADSYRWLRFYLGFLPFRSSTAVLSSCGLVYLWCESFDSADLSKSLVVCNPLTRWHQVLPRLGSAWSRHGSVLVGGYGRVLVLTELATLYFSAGFDKWLKFSSNLPSKPRSPVMMSDSVYALCDVGSPWRAQWKLYCCSLARMNSLEPWFRLEKHEWGDVFGFLKRPRLICGDGKRILMVGGLKSLLNSSCSTILILRLDLETLEWDEAGRMPVEMFKFFQESSKFKVFGTSNRICFSAKRIGRLALWESCALEESNKGLWRWITDVPGIGDGLCRGFSFEANLNALP